MISKEYLSVFGSVTINRAYYWKSSTQGVFPLDHQLNLPEGKFSYLLQDIVLNLLAASPYKDVLETIYKIFKIRLWSKAIEKIVFRAAVYVDCFYEEAKEYKKAEGKVIAVTMDCKGVPMVPSERAEKKDRKEPKARREKGDKRKGLRRDAVVTSHFTFNPVARSPEELVKSILKQHTEQERQDKKRKKKSDRYAVNLKTENPLINKFMLLWMARKMHLNVLQIK